MKKLLLVLLTFIPLILNGQVSLSSDNKKVVSHIPTNRDGQAEYTGVVAVDTSFKKNEIHQALNEWIARVYVSGKSVIQNNDKDAGVIIGRGATKNILIWNVMSQQNFGNFTYLISLYSKDGKAKYVINGFSYSGCEMIGFRQGYDLAGTPIKGLNKSYWNKLQSQTNDEIVALVNNLKSFLKNYKSTSNSDW